MEWYQVAVLLLGSGGVVTGIYKLLTMKQDKESLIIQNLSKIIDEVRENHEQYKKETDEKIDKLNMKIERMEIKDAFQMRAINKAYRCKLSKCDADCPVLIEMEEIKDKAFDNEK